MELFSTGVFIPKKPTLGSAPWALNNKSIFSYQVDKIDGCCAVCASSPKRWCVVTVFMCWEIR